MIGIGYAAEEKKPYDDGELLYGKIHWNRF
jgi:hypothetical protein